MGKDAPVGHRFDHEQIRSRMELFKPQRERYRAQLQRGVEEIRPGCFNALQFALWAAWSHLVLEDDDTCIRRELRDAVSYGRIVLQYGPTHADLRAAEVHVGVGSERNWSLVKPIPQTKSDAIPPHDFELVLNVLVAFGNGNDRAAVAATPRQRYQHPDVLARESYYMYLDALRLYLGGDRGNGVAQASAAVAACDQPLARPRIAAFAALAANDAVSFVRELMEALKGHQREYRRRPHLAEGAVYMPGLMLSRLALEAAMALPSDLPYLPTRFAKDLTA